MFYSMALGSCCYIVYSIHWNRKETWLFVRWLINDAHMHESHTCMHIHTRMCVQMCTHMHTRTQTHRHGGDLVLQTSAYQPDLPLHQAIRTAALVVAGHARTPECLFLPLHILWQNWSVYKDLIPILCEVTSRVCLQISYHMSPPVWGFQRSHVHNRGISYSVGNLTQRSSPTPSPSYQLRFLYRPTPSPSYQLWFLYPHLMRKVILR